MKDDPDSHGGGGEHSQSLAHRTRNPVLAFAATRGSIKHFPLKPEISRQQKIGQQLFENPQRTDTGESMDLGGRGGRGNESKEASSEMKPGGSRCKNAPGARREGGSGKAPSTPRRFRARGPNLEAPAWGGGEGQASKPPPGHAPTWDHRAGALSPRDRAGKTAAEPEGGRASCEGAQPGTYAAASSSGFPRAGGRPRWRRCRSCVGPAWLPPPRSRPRGPTCCSTGAAAAPAPAHLAPRAPVPGSTRRRERRPCRGAPWAHAAGPLPSAAATAAAQASPSAGPLAASSASPAGAEAHPRPAASSVATTRSKPIPAGWGKPEGLVSNRLPDSRPIDCKFVQ